MSTKVALAEGHSTKASAARQQRLHSKSDYFSRPGCGASHALVIWPVNALACTGAHHSALSRAA